ncbi:hypothetical protein [Streptomyces sp. NPDC002078]
MLDRIKEFLKYRWEASLLYFLMLAYVLVPMLLAHLPENYSKRAGVIFILIVTAPLYVIYAYSEARYRRAVERGAVKGESRMGYLWWIIAIVGSEILWGVFGHSPDFETRAISSFQTLAFWRSVYFWLAATPQKQNKK